MNISIKELLVRVRRRLKNELLHKRGFILVPQSYQNRATFERLLWRFTGALFPHYEVSSGQSYGGEHSVFQEYAQTFPDGTIVDIGAADGRTLSNISAASKLNTKLILVENSAIPFAQLSLNFYRSTEPTLMRMSMTPDKVEGFVKLFSLQKLQFALSLDIDSYDYFVAEKFLAFSKPNLLCVEWNPIFPPNIFFACNPNFERWEGNWFFGASAAAWCKLFDDYGYAVEDVLGMSLIAKPEEEVENKLRARDILSIYLGNPEYSETPTSSNLRQGQLQQAMNVIDAILEPYNGKYKMFEL
jgi:hypothetical protein